MLTKDCFSAACTVGFDPYQGFYHTGRHGRPSLALDLVEEFRPVIADSVVLNLINNGMLINADFLTWRDACYLTDAGRKCVGTFRGMSGLRRGETWIPTSSPTTSVTRSACARSPRSAKILDCGDNIQCFFAG
jgi:CRISPR associated protein Cas1